jgi:acetyltransferase-like isoleucine patch superfamily enzyme
MVYLALNKFFKNLLRFFAMNSPAQSIRIAMYRKAGVSIGEPRSFGNHIWIDLNLADMVTIGKDVVLAGFIYILAHSFIMEGYKEEGFKPVVIKDGVRIGIGAIILPGVTIGENSVIGAGALVNRDIPPNCLAVGVPAKPIKFFANEPQSTQ